MKRYKCILLILLIVSCYSGWSQTQSDLPGDWNVTKVTITDKAGEIPPESLKKIENMFMQTQFHFKADGLFIIDSPQKALQFKKSQWTFNDKDKSISVSGTDMTNKEGLLMKLYVKVENAKWIFQMDDAPIILEVQKAVKK